MTNHFIIKYDCDGFIIASISSHSMLIFKCFTRVLITDSLYILYFKLGRERRDISGISKSETFVTREQTEGSRRTENADVVVA